MTPAQQLNADEMFGLVSHADADHARALADLAVVRRLIRAARAAGWEHLTYGSEVFGDGREHVFRSPALWRYQREQVSCWRGELDYQKADAYGVRSTLRPDNAAEVESWLYALGVLPTAAQVAAAILQPDAERE